VPVPNYSNYSIGPPSKEQASMAEEGRFYVADYGEPSFVFREPNCAALCRIKSMLRELNMRGYLVTEPVKRLELRGTLDQVCENLKEWLLDDYADNEDWVGEFDYCVFKEPDGFKLLVYTRLKPLTKPRGGKGNAFYGTKIDRIGEDDYAIW